MTLVLLVNGVVEVDAAVVFVTCRDLTAGDQAPTVVDQGPHLGVLPGNVLGLDGELPAENRDLVDQSAH